MYSPEARRTLRINNTNIPRKGKNIFTPYKFIPEPYKDDEYDKFIEWKEKTRQKNDKDAGLIDTDRRSRIKIKIISMYTSIIKKMHEKRRLRHDLNEQVNVAKKFKSLISKDGFFDIRGRIREWKDKHRTTKTMMINMELRNGTHCHFLIILERPYFVFEESVYVIDDDYKYYCTSSKIYMLDYHQDCSLPIRRKFSLNDILSGIKSNDLEINNSVNPSTLRRVLDSHIIQSAVKGAELGEWIKFIKTMIIINVIGVILILILTLLKFNPKAG